MFATAHYRARKPDPTVFSRVLERYGFSSEDTFFVDDHPDNIRGAQEIGITSKWFSPSDTGASVKEAITDFVAGRS
jgi:putative hydrolase of the HAD superfamily